jgi:hypothetical protein
MMPPATQPRTRELGVIGNFLSDLRSGKHCYSYFGMRIAEIGDDSFLSKGAAKRWLSNSRRY